MFLLTNFRNAKLRLRLINANMGTCDVSGFLEFPTMTSDTANDSLKFRVFLLALARTCFVP